MRKQGTLELRAFLNSVPERFKCQLNDPATLTNRRNTVTDLKELEGQITSLDKPMNTKVSPSAYNANSPYSFDVEDISLFKAQ
jgi:hypothetical protein